MSQTAPNTITALPTPPSTLDPTNFDTRADAFLGQLPTTVTELNSANNTTYNNAVDAYNSALTASAASTAAVNASNTAQTYAGAIAWVSGTTYVLGDVRWSPANGRIYRRIIAGAGTTDPANDATNWALVPITVPFTHVSALVQQGVSGYNYSLENSSLQSGATNLLLYSSQFDTGTWVKSSTTVTADFTMSPTGDTNGDKIVEVAATATHYVKQLITQANNVALTFSVEVKAYGRSTVRLSMDQDDGYTNGVYADFTLTGVGSTASATNMGTGSGVNAAITFLGDGWYLCKISGTPSSTAGTQVGCRVWLNGGISYAGDGTSGVAVAEAQLETGTNATSRIATGAAQVARAANVIAPSRLILPASPVNDMFVGCAWLNGIDTNVIDPNGSSIMGITGPMKLDSANAQAIKLQYISNTWRLV